MIKRRKNITKRPRNERSYRLVCENEENITFLIELNDGILQRSNDKESGLGFLSDVLVVGYFVIFLSKKKILKFVLHKAYKFCLMF